MVQLALVIKIEEVTPVGLSKKILFLLCIWNCWVVCASTIELTNIDTKKLNTSQYQMLLKFTQMPLMPKFFSVEESNNILFDFANVKNKLDVYHTFQKISFGVLESFQFVDDGDKTRLIINVSKILPFNIELTADGVLITLDASDTRQPLLVEHTIQAIDFRRGEKGEGRYIIDMSHEDIIVDLTEELDEIVLEFQGVSIHNSLLRQFNVGNFYTPIKQIYVEQSGLDIIMRIHIEGEHEKSIYQVGKQYVVDVRPMTSQEKNALKLSKFKFTGERISLNFQDIEVRDVLQLMADFTGLNIVTSETVSGNVTLRLENVPWDQALDLILKAKGLGKTQSGNLIHVAPSEELSAREQLELEAIQQVSALTQMVEEFIQINFAKASDMANILKDADNTILSERGQVSVDERTNILLIQDTESKIVEIKKLLERLDVPIRQVMIESQIILSKDKFNEALGIQFNGAGTPKIGRHVVGIAPRMDSARTFANDPTSKVTNSDNLFFDFSETSTKGALGLALAKLPGGTLLDLELQASEAEEKSKIIARPKLMTLDQQTAIIETGQEIPYVTSSSNGGSTTTFKSAVLKLEVTPSITPDNQISMEISLSQDEPGVDFNGNQGIDTTSIETKVLVNDGETVVLGGVFQVTQGGITRNIPYLSRIPFLGKIFSANNYVNDRNEVLIFITPRILTGNSNA